MSDGSRRLYEIMIDPVNLNPTQNTNNGIASVLFLLMAARRSNSASSFVDNFSDNAGYAIARQIKSVDKKHQLPELYKSTFEFTV